MKLNPILILLTAVALLFGLNSDSVAGADKLVLSSPAFRNNADIPQLFSCEGRGINPEIVIKNIPKKAKSLVLIVEDPDAPGGSFIHWLLYDVAPTESIRENSVPGKQGINDVGKALYSGPCAPAGKKHRYFFKVYALDRMLNLYEGADKITLEKEMKGHVLAQGELIGLFKKSQQ